MLWVAVNLFILLALGAAVYFVFTQQEKFNQESPYPTPGISHFAGILSHNLLNAAQTIIGFVLFPLMYLYTWGYSLIIISLGISQYGLEYGLSRLLPHALVEIPTILAYQYFAFGLLKTALQTKKISRLISYVKENYYFLCFCVCGIFIAALVEGFIG